MKNIVLFFFVTSLFGNIYSQDKNLNFEYYNSKLDSIISEYSISDHKYPHNLNISFTKANLNKIEREKIIEKIRMMFEQKRYPNLYLTAHILLYAIWRITPVTNTVKIKQKLLELYLQYYFYPGPREYLICSDYSDLSIKKDYTPKACRRILEILNGNKTEKEYDIYLAYKKALPTSYDKMSWDYAKIEMRKRKIQNDTILKEIRDSLLSDYIVYSAKESLELEQIQPDIILMAGFLGMKECIPTMQKNLQAEIAENNYYKGTEIAYRLALAKLGDKEQYQYILDTIISTEYFTKNFLSYFRDDNITWRYVNANYSSSGSYYNGNFYVPMRLYTMDAICPFIEDMPKDLKFKRKTKNEDYKNAETLYEWLMKNRDNIKFNYDVNEGWFWSD